MRKKLLSLALALTMCLGLTVPAFAAESKWNLEIAGKSNAEVFLGEKTFTLRDLAVTGHDETDAEDGIIWDTWTRTDSRQWKAENVYALSKGDEVVFTKGGENFEGFYVTGWSDPDGDGVYDQRIAAGMEYEQYQGVLDWDPQPVLPITDSVRCSMGTTKLLFFIPDPKYGYTYTGYGSWDMDFANGPFLPVTEMKMRPDFLLEIFGPNTLVNFTTLDGDWSCNFLVEGNASQPTAPAATGSVFTDVAVDSPYKDAIAWAVKEGITKGTTATTFGPNQTCTVSHILTFILRYRLGGQDPAKEDISELCKEFSAGLGLPNLTPDQPCTRILAVTMMSEFFGDGSRASVSFTDVPSSPSYYAAAVSWAVAKGITSGTSATTFSPNNICTRGQIVTFLYRLSQAK